MDTYLRFAEAVGRLDISQGKETLPELAGDRHEGGDGCQATGAREAARAKARDLAGQDGQGQECSASRGRRKKA